MAAYHVDTMELVSPLVWMFFSIHVASLLQDVSARSASHSRGSLSLPVVTGQYRCVF
jgi:hypothetical protein